MILVKTRKEIEIIVSREKHKGKKISLIPTMGYLHEGHGTLIKSSKAENYFTIAYIFVNPAQFNQIEDYERYPVDLEKDRLFCEEAGVDALFIPGLNEIYSEGIPDIQIRIPHLMKNLCAISRPGHFEGVLMVLSKFFIMIKPDFVFMGKKDYQQWKIIEYYTRSLGFKIQIIGVETKRAEDGLALSSRNALLTVESRKSALRISEALFHAQSLLQHGETDIEKIKLAINGIIHAGLHNKIDYLEIVDPETLEILADVKLPLLIAAAVFVGEVRLIDNILVSSK